MHKKVRFYFGGIDPLQQQLKKKHGVVLGVHQLMSFAQLFHLKMLSRMNALRDMVFTDVGKSVLFDSGAFSVMNSGSIIDIDSYIDFIKMVVDLYPDREMHFIGLDVIGDDEATHQNFAYEQKKGVKTIPVYHAREPIENLDRYLDITDHIAVGGIVGQSVKRTKTFLDVGLFGETNKTVMDHVFERIEQKGWKGKVHGLGVGELKAMKEYPFYSVDTTTCLILGTRGRIRLVDGVAWHVSEDPLPAIYLQGVEDRCSKLGMTLAELKESSHMKVVYNMQQFVEDCLAEGIELDYGSYYTKSVR